MRAVIVTHSSTYESRAEAVGDFLRRQGYEVTWIYGDFDHLRKETIRREEPDHVYLHMTPYATNLSVRRILSIRNFATAVEKYLDDLFDAGVTPGILYFLIPANTLAAVAGRLHRKYGVRVILDIIDLWPESLPLKGISVLPPVVRWKRMRDDNLADADVIFTECRLYQKELHLPEDRCRTLYWFKDEACGGSNGRKQDTQDQTDCGATDDKASGCMTEKRSAAASEDRLNIAYMGAVNHIIDIPLIIRVLQEIGSMRPVTLHLIGEGDSKQAFLDALCQAGIPFIDYGAVYDEEKKRKILTTCRFGLNLMKPGVHVGLTMKSIDYLSFGLPLINSIAGDTEELVSAYDVGVNIDRNDLRSGAAAICRASYGDDSPARSRARNVYRTYFTKEAFEKVLAEALPL